MSEMIERVARAICAADGVDPDKAVYGAGALWPKGEKHVAWEARVKQASAALDEARK